MSTVVFLSGTSQGDALGGIGRSFETHFNSLGHELVELKLAEQHDVMAALKNILKKGRPAFVFSFMSVGLNMSVKNKGGQIENLWEAMHIPFITIFGDSPAYFFDRHILPSTNFAGIYGFPDHLELRKSLPKMEGFACGGPPILVDNLRREDIDFNKKLEGNVIFLKNGNDPKQLTRVWRETLPAKALRALMEIASQLTNNLNEATASQIDNAVTSYFIDKTIDITHFVKLRLFFIAQLDDYVRRVKSTFIAQALLDFPVQVHGTNWEHVDFSGRRATLVKVCDYGKSRQLISESLGVLDMSPNTSLAPHDRVMRALGRYTLCLTNEQKFFKQEVPQHKSMTFRFDKHNLQGKIADILARPEHYVELGQDVAETFRRTHPPEIAIGQLMEIAELIQVNQLPVRPPGYPEFFVWPPKSLS